MKKDFDALAFDWCMRGEEIAKLQERLDRAVCDVDLALQALGKDKKHVATELLKTLVNNLKEV